MCKLKVSILFIIFGLFFSFPTHLFAESKYINNGFMVHPVTVTRKVLRDEPLPECFGNLSAKPYKKISKLVPYEAKLKKTLKVKLAHNEYESGQIVIKSLTQDLRNVRVKIKLIHQKTAKPFPQNNISLFRVGYVEVYNLWNKSQSLGWWPDPLFPLGLGEGFDIKKGRNQPVLIRFYADEKTLSGIYEGEITISADGCSKQILPIQVLVWDFSVPKDQHVTISIPIWGGQMEKMYGKAVAKKWRRKYISMLLDYRISPFHLTMEETVYARSRGMKQFCMLALPKDHVPKNLKEIIKRKAKEWEQAELFEKGAVPYVLLGDEPHPKHWPFILEQGRIIHKVDSRILRMNTIAIELLVNTHQFKGVMDAYEKTYDTLGEAVDYFIVGTGCYPVGEATELAYKKGQKVWWYSVADVVYIPTKGGYVRVHFWKMWKYDVPGWLHWGMSYWGDTNIRGKDGKKWPDVPWDTKSSRSGDGYLVYPAPGGRGYLPSFRLEIIRDGVEDYEYFYLLRELTEKLETVKDKTEAIVRQLNRNRKLLRIEKGVVNSYRDATTDGNVILSARRRLAGAIITTQKLLEKSQ